MNVAVVQTNARADKEANVADALRKIEVAAKKGAEFILFPEAFNFRGKRNSGFADIAENIPGPSIKPIMSLAKSLRVNVLAGSICESAKGSAKVYNTSVLVGRDGTIKAKYRKNHLFDAVIGQKKLTESTRFLPGRKKTMARIAGWKMGLAICYDLRFPDMFQRYADNGADILCIPSVFTRKTGQAHWKTLLRARAIENLSYVLAPNQIGKDSQGVPSYGHSMIVDPWGEVIAEASGNKTEIIYAILKKEEIIKARRMLPGQRKYKR